MRGILGVVDEGAPSPDTRFRDRAAAGKLKILNRTARNSPTRAFLRSGFFGVGRVAFPPRAVAFADRCAACLAVGGVIQTLFAHAATIGGMEPTQACQPGYDLVEPRRMLNFGKLVHRRQNGGIVDRRKEKNCATRSRFPMTRREIAASSLLVRLTACAMACRICVTALCASSRQMHGSSWQLAMRSHRSLNHC